LIRRLPDAADARAWDEFVQVYGPLIYRLARKRGLQPADADDVVQQVLAAVVRSVEEWLARRDRGPFRAWLLTIARNLAVNTLARPHSRSIAAGGSDNVQRLAGYAAGCEEDGWFDLEYRREVFRWAAEQVRSEVALRTWQAFWLTAVEELPTAVVAEQLKMTEGSVYVARSRVMARLQAVVRNIDS
jgi:RNA polymerase sigma-70 factor (ECF subfamily)